MRILITVKTYPTISETLKEEIVCTAGLNKEGEWIRLYPIPFRTLDYVAQYKKYDWIEVDVKKHKSDWRHESYSPINLETHPIQIIGHIDTKQNWEERKNLVLRNIYSDLSKLIEDSKEEGKKISLATFKPTHIDDFIYNPVFFSRHKLHPSFKECQKPIYYSWFVLSSQNQSAGNGYLIIRP